MRGLSAVLTCGCANGAPPFVFLRPKEGFPLVSLVRSTYLANSHRTFAAFFRQVH